MHTAQSPSTFLAGLRRRSFRDLLAYSDAELAAVDPLEMNLLVAQEIPGLSHLDLDQYKGIADKWAADIKWGLGDAEKEFHKTPQDWKNDLNFFRLGYMCQYLDRDLGIAYREDQRDLKAVWYTDPSDLFLNGVMDSRRGTCGNMAALHVALGWRLGWPVSLACVWAHLICRYDDGKITHNIEASDTGRGGFSGPADDYYITKYRLPAIAVTCGSDLRAVTPREMLGIFVGLRARHLYDIDRIDLAELDFLLARYLFPLCRHLHFNQIMTSVPCGMRLFDASERYHPTQELTSRLQEAGGTNGTEAQPKTGSIISTPMQESGNGIAAHAKY